LISVWAPFSHADECGQPLTDDAQPRAVDALHILKSSIGTRGCTLGACDVNSDCRISVSDAYGVLAASVGRGAEMDCDSSCPTDVPCAEAGAPMCNGICPAGSVCTTRDGGDVDPDERATVCHVPPGNPDNEHTIVVGVSAVAAHLRHGDYLGPCESDVVDCDPEASDCPAKDDAATYDDADGDSDSDSDGDDLDCFCMPSMVSTTTLPEPTTTTTLTEPSTTTTLSEPTTTSTLTEPTTTTSTVGEPTTTITTTTSTTTTLGGDDADNDGLPEASDPCPQDARNACFGPAAVDMATQLEIRINANASTADECSGDRTDCNGDVWYGDFGYNDGGGHSDCRLNGGEPGCVIAGLTAIFGCEDDATEDLLQCEHFDRPTEPELSYAFDVPDGTYLVNLFFANTIEETAEIGDRVFDIVVEGETVYAGFDQVAAAGGSGIAVVRSAIVTVGDGDGLTIAFGHVTENPAIKAIEVLAQPAP
jgi:hypothetical protein